MEALQNRIDSYSKPKRVKNPAKPSTSVAAKWPHPPSFRATPESLAEAGFYYNPSYADRDNVSCFMCQKQLSDWDADDDPFDIHWAKCGKDCCWASVRCGLRNDMDSRGRFTFSNKTRLPSSKAMEKARLETFSAGGGWVHDQNRTHGASSKKMARAGFVFTPQLPGDDLATCLYCNVSLSGWDEDDDPMEEHRKRDAKSRLQCPLFSSSSSSSEAKPPSKSQSTTGTTSRSRSKHKDALQPTKTHDGDPEESDSTTAAAPVPVKGKTPRKPRSTSSSVVGSTKTPRTLTRSKSRSKVELDEVVEDEEDEENAAQAMTKTRSRSQSVSRRAVEGADEDEEAQAPKKLSRSKSKAKVAEDEEEGVHAPAPRRPPRSKAKMAVVEGSERNIDAPVPRKPSRSRAKATVVEEEAEIEEPALRKASRSKPKPKTVIEEEVEEDMQGVVEVAKLKPKPKPITRKASKSTAKPKPITVPPPSSPDMFVDDEEEEEEAAAFVKKSLFKGEQRAAKFESEADEMVTLPPSSPPVAFGAPLDRQAGPRPTASTSISILSSGRIAPGLPIEDKGKEKDGEEAGETPSAHTKASKSESELPEPQSTEGEEEEEEEVIAMLPPQVKKVSVGLVAAPSKLSSRILPANINKMEEVPQPPPVEVKEPSPKPVAAPRKLKPRNRKGKTSPGPEEAEKLQAAVKVVEISTDEERDGEDEGKGKGENLISGTDPKPRPPMVKKQVFVEIVKRPSVPAKVKVDPAPKRPTAEERDVEMDELDEVQDVAITEDNRPSPPSTPPRQTALTLPTTPNQSSVSTPLVSALPTSNSTQPLPPIFPPLSKLPFTSLQELTEAELDMTVEEWIHYQMGVEFDKFKRDGERELARFKKRAEEVRGIIEGL